MTTVAIHQPQYLPYLGFFHKLIHCDVFILLDDVQFTKGGFQNRNKIKSPDGWQWLTVPVLQRARQLICEVNLNDSVPWQRKHWSALVSNYAPAPFFDLYAKDFQQTLTLEWKELTALNTALMKWVMAVLEIGTEIRFSSGLPSTGVATERLIELCQHVGATRYLSGPGGKEYMDLQAFDRAGIEVIWQDFGAPKYLQQFSEAGFIGNLSIVDALFNCGPGTRGLLN